MASDAEKVEVKSRAAWRRWLHRHHAQAEGVWLVRYKKGSPHELPYDAAVEEALCFGWVDSLPRKLDDRRTMLLMSPRKPGSGWSEPNKQRVRKMVDAGLMTPAGLAKVDAAKADGSWTKLDAVEALTVPADLAAALRKLPPAAAHFEGFPRSAMRGILEWIEQAKRPETRAKRVRETAALAQRDARANQWKRR